MLDLEALLRADDDATLDLSGRLGRIRASAERIWVTARLPWFTDHSATRHSRRIVQLLGALVEKLQDGPQGLNRSELYVLLASAYLHDIGMQDFRMDGRGYEELGIADYELVRKRHPERAKDLIVSRALSLDPGRDQFRIDIDDELQYLLPIALVSQGHGSSYFEQSVDELRSGDFAPENQSLRGALLTALLLFADELDLHEDRASFPAEMGLSPLSALHHHVNHYVTRVRVTEGETTRVRRVHLSFSFPQGSDDYQGDVRLYVASKLASQATRVNPVLRADTDGYLELDPVIRVRTRTETIAGARRELPEAALARLRLELRQDTLIGRDDLRRLVERLIEESEPQIIELAAIEDSDLPAVLSWLEALTEHSGVRTAHLDLGTVVATETSDLIQLLSDALPPSPETTTDAERLNGCGPLAAVAIELGTYSVWVLESADRLLPETQAWLRAELDGMRNAEAPALVVVTRSSESAPIVPDGTTYELGPLTADVVAPYLRKRFGDDEEEASHRAHAGELLSGGSPGRMLTAVAARLNRTWMTDA
jgi:hypothetical protein